MNRSYRGPVIESMMWSHDGSDNRSIQMPSSTPKWTRSKRCPFVPRRRQRCRSRHRQHRRPGSPEYKLSDPSLAGEQFSYTVCILLSLSAGEMARSGRLSVFTTAQSRNFGRLKASTAVAITFPKRILKFARALKETTYDKFISIPNIFSPFLL